MARRWLSTRIHKYDDVLLLRHVPHAVTLSPTDGMQFMPRTSPFEIKLSRKERAVLQYRAAKYTSPYCEVVRAKIILLAAEGTQNNHIAQSLSLPHQIVCRWRKRFFEERLAGLDERPRRGRPRLFSPSSGHGSKGVGL